jgi:hypothetical protein
MDHSRAMAKVTPNRTIPRVVGILNIVFAAGLLLVGLCFMGLTIASPWIAQAAKEAQARSEVEQQEKQKAELKALEEMEQEAKTEEEKAELRGMRKASKPNKARLVATKLPMFDVMRLMRDRRLTAWTWTQVGTGIVVNLLLLASGIGLVQLKPWGRTLGLWTAATKIIRLVVLYAYALVAIVPALARMMGEEAFKMVIQQHQVTGRPLPGYMTLSWWTKTYTLIYSVMFIGMIVAGSVYPLVVLWLLSRPSARAACATNRSPSERVEPC